MTGSIAADYCQPPICCRKSMRLLFALRTVGLLCLLFSAALLPPLALALLYHDGEANHLALSLVCSMLAGFALWLPAARRRATLRTRDGFLVVALLWILIGALGSLPFILGFHLGVADAVFESISAFTTTGATVVVGLDRLPPSILFYRQELQWLGGIGVVVSAIALIPMLGVGGMQMLKAEIPGPIKDDKLTPRIAQTARMLWRLYLGMTLICTLLFWVGGMTVFDAVAHAMSTVSTGGFSTHDASLAFYDSVFIEWVAMVFMLLGGINFAIHFLVLSKRDLRFYWRNEEVRTFLLLVIVTTLVVAVALHLHEAKATPGQAFRHAAFAVISVITSTGFGIDDFSAWPTLLPLVLIFLSFVGGCAGSTAGGMKVIRYLVLVKQVRNELRSLIHPALISPIKVGEHTVSNRTIQSIWAYFGVYVGLFALMMLILMGMGLDQITAFGGVATCMNNLGPGLGDVATNFASVSDGAKWVFSGAMLLGRLEIFTLFVLFMPEFWRA